ncbi:MAG: 3-phosphoshikimate 1-carboxyvinyltransferase, partial [Gemmatimonadetes bacterium]|nr:3-phosphoshikimate 1-carboxyvinyltransferase [Gemmatimonadota bacterium]
MGVGGRLSAGVERRSGEGLVIRVPGDKSIAQRALILGALAEGESRIGAAPRGADPLSTAGALAALGVEILGPDGPASEPVRIAGPGLRAWRQPAAPLDLRNSGTGARLLAGALAAQPLSVVLTGDDSLSRRPMERIAAPLRRMGAGVEYVGRPGVLPMRVTGGPLTGIRHGGEVASAQVKSAVLLAALGAGVPVEVREPRRSRDHSERMLEAMGVE